MKISLDWIRDFIDFGSLEPKQIESNLTSLGLECNILNNHYNFDSNVVIGQILCVKKHPNADRLNVCTVNVGCEDNLSIICGAPNVKKDIYVAVAKIGAEIGEEKFKIKKAKLRDVYSYGMICSGEELGLNDENDGIMVLESNSKIGTPLLKHFKQNILLDIDLTPNRGDCLSHLGVAREISTFINKDISTKENQYKKEKFKTKDFINVNIENQDLCIRYSCIIIKNIKVEDSPTWLKDRLQSIGCNSINNIVDVANYVMYDMGQPLHAFDYDKINGKNIFIRTAYKNEKLETINNNQLILENNDIVIADKDKAIALAGIIGSSNSHVEDNTKTILLESAIFNETYVRRSSKKHLISTESSKRFERCVDVNSSLTAIDNFISILQSINNCKVSSNYIDIYPKTISRKNIPFNLIDCNKYLGTSLNIKEVKFIFEKLDVLIESNKNSFNCLTPTYRNDLLNEIDLYEEVARVYGYDNIPTKTSFNVPYSVLIDDSYSHENIIRNSLSNNGFNEHYSNSLYSEKDITVSNKKPLRLKNPLSRDLEYLRNSMLPGLLKAVSYNLNRNIDYIKLYEIGSCQYYDKKMYNLSKETRFLNILWAGSETKHWIYPNYIDIYTIKGDTDLFFQNIGLNDIIYKYDSNNIFLYVKGEKIASIKVIDEKILDDYEINQNVFCFELNLDKLKKIIDKKKNKYIRLGQFPGIKRDISFFVNDNFNHADLVNTINLSGGKFLNDVKLFDYYVSDEFEDSKKSLAYTLEFKSQTKTLTDAEINKDVDNIINKLKTEFKIELR